MIKKAVLTIRTVKNWPVVALDLFKLVKGFVFYQLRNGLKMKSRAHSTDFAEIIIINGEQEYPSVFFPKNENQIVLDLGAHIGTFSLFYNIKLSGRGATIYAVEPNVENYQLLNDNIELNDFKNIKTFNFGVFGKSGEAIISVEQGKYDGGHLVPCINSDKEKKIQVFSLSDFCKNNNIGQVDLMKMDIEGSEYSIFDLEMDFIVENVKSIFVELHNIDEQNNYLKFRDFIKTRGFIVEAEIMGRTLFLKNRKFL